MRGGLPMGLLKSIYKEPYYNDRVSRFIKKTNNQKKLFRLICESSSDLTRTKAAQKINDPEIAMALVDKINQEYNSKDIDFTVTGMFHDLIKSITDENWLKKTYHDKSNYHIVRLEALKQIKDSSFLINVIEEYEDDSSVETALNRIDLSTIPENQALKWIVMPFKCTIEKRRFWHYEWRIKLIKEYPFTKESLDKIMTVFDDEKILQCTKIKILEKDKSQEYWRILANHGPHQPVITAKDLEYSRASYRGDIQQRKEAVKNLLPIPENQPLLEELASNYLNEASDILPLVIERLTRKEFVKKYTTLNTAYTNQNWVSSVEKMFRDRLKALENKK